MTIKEAIEVLVDMELSLLSERDEAQDKVAAILIAIKSLKDAKTKI
jgi:hypothetical protein